ncbi:hypothetical protein G7046_g9671 [Stylonectria norvegica]|nr:hypothetical protein G7046_g9671 [Stylonectria norvegica]
MAILRALETAPPHQPVQIITDSQYSINCVTQWALNWARKGWKTATGEVVKNQDIIRNVLAKMEEREKGGAHTYYQWVKGHAADRGNVAADGLAVKGAKMPAESAIMLSIERENMAPQCLEIDFAHTVSTAPLGTCWSGTESLRFEFYSQIEVKITKSTSHPRIATAHATTLLHHLPLDDRLLCVLGSVSAFAPTADPLPRRLVLARLTDPGSIQFQFQLQLQLQFPSSTVAVPSISVPSTSSQSSCVHLAVLTTSTPYLFHHPRVPQASVRLCTSPTNSPFVASTAPRPSTRFESFRRSPFTVHRPAILSPRPSHCNPRHRQQLHRINHHHLLTSCAPRETPAAAPLVMTPAPIGPGSPLIAGATMSGGEFNDFFDDDPVASSLFDFSNSPDTLQTFDTLSSSDTKNFVSPQELTSGLPDSPNGSYQDSSSESASSSKRTGSSASSKTAANAATTGDTEMDGNVRTDWGNTNFGGLEDDENAFTFGGRDHTDSTGIDGIYGFNDQDDSFMDHTFDFESPSTSPEAVNVNQMNMASPGMPTIKTNSPRRSNATPKKTSTQGHHKGPSQYSLSSSMNGLNTMGSREVSPMSNIVMSHGGSPSALFNNPSPTDYSRMINGGPNGHMAWPSNMDVTAGPEVKAVPTPMFGGQMSQPVSMPQQMPVFPSNGYNFTGRYELRILPTPLKSRVETQIPIKMTLTPLPPGVTRIHLPGHTISKPKLLARPNPERSPDMLELCVTLVCTSAMEGDGVKQRALERAAGHDQRYLPPLDDDKNSPQNGGDVRICVGCITRERKRAARKKIKKPEEERVWSQDEERRVIVFNTQEVKEWQPLSGVMDPTGRPEPVVPNGARQIDAPMRIACYCRHHGEKMGFNVIFTIKDWQDKVIAQAMSNPIMITDDHKTHPMAQLTAQPSLPEAPVASTAVNSLSPSQEANSLVSPTPNRPFQSPSNGDLANMHRNSQSSYQGSTTTSGKTTPTGATGRVLSRPASPIMGGPMAKKRKASNSRVPNGLAMTRLDTTPSPSLQQANLQISASTSPFTPNLNGFSQNDHIFGQQNGHVPFSTGPPTPITNDQVPFFSNRSASMDNLAMAQLYSAPASGHPSRAPSPNGLRNGVATTQNQLAQALSSSLFTLPLGMNQTRPGPPTIHKIIPNEGPKIGGIEVTVLGGSFYQGLEVWFGDHKATTTTFWGESSLVCLLPPSPVAGAVPVTFKHQTGQGSQAFPMAKQPPIFKYVDDNEEKLIRTALAVLGQKMSGRMMDVSDLARRILQQGNGGWSGGSSAGPSSGGGGGQMFNHASYAHLESQLLKCLDLIDLDDSAHRTRLDLRRPTGHTMLHLACSLGYHRFVAALLARGANPDARDKGGFTPLHIAAISNHAEIVRRLMLVGADPTIRSLSGLTPADVAESRGVLRAIRRSERHVRSRSSGGSLHSRTSSATSLRSLWEPMTKVHTHEEPLSADSNEESPEYTSGDFSDEDPDDHTYLSMRRSSGFRQDRERPDLHPEDVDQLEEGMASPTTALAAALKDQFQQQIHQFQQSMALHFQNLPHFPQMQMPTFPGMPMLPGYQAYLQQAPFMRRVTQMMPGMTGPPTPNTEGDEAPKIDNSWWGALPTKTGDTVMPPAYEDIYPQQQLDTKQESAVLAAADAEADIKCASLYDQGSTSATVEIKAQTSKTHMSNTLTIGRKNAITKEQQEQFLRAREEKLKKLSSDRNLFFIWIPLLIAMIVTMLYSYFPGLFGFAFALVHTVVAGGTHKSDRTPTQNNLLERIVGAT